MSASNCAQRQCGGCRRGLSLVGCARYARPREGGSGCRPGAPPRGRGAGPRPGTPLIPCRYASLLTGMPPLSPGTSLSPFGTTLHPLGTAVSPLGRPFAYWVRASPRSVQMSSRSGGLSTHWGWVSPGGMSSSSIASHPGGPAGYNRNMVEELLSGILHVVLSLSRV